MDSLVAAWDWLTANHVGLGALAALIAIILFVWAFLSGTLSRLLAPWRKPAPMQVELVNANPDPQPQLTVIDFIRIRRELKAEILAELDRTDVIEERARLQARIDELSRQINDPEGSFAAERQRLADLEQRLIREGNELGAERLQSAIDALRRGETNQAEAVFSEIVARDALAVQRTARAEYGLGEIAEGRVDWAAAARHYARATTRRHCAMARICCASPAREPTATSLALH